MAEEKLISDRPCKRVGREGKLSRVRATIFGGW